TCFLQSKFGPANLRLLSDAQLVEHFRPIGNSLPKPTAIVIGMAGARTEADRERIRRAAAKVWPGVLCYATNDLELAIVAADCLVKARPTATAQAPAQRAGRLDWLGPTGR